MLLRMGLISYLYFTFYLTKEYSQNNVCCHPYHINCLLFTILQTDKKQGL